MTFGNNPKGELQPSKHPHNEELFISMYETYNEVLFLIAYNILGNKDDARDVVQTLFAKLWKTKRYLEITYDGYLKKACKNACLDFIDKQNNKVAIHGQFMKIAPKHQDEHFSRSFEMRDYFIAAYEQLTNQQKQVLSLLYLQNCSYKEAAKRMGISINTLKTYRRSLIQILRNNFKQLIDR